MAMLLITEIMKNVQNSNETQIVTKLGNNNVPSKVAHRFVANDNDDNPYPGITTFIHCCCVTMVPQHVTSSVHASLQLLSSISLKITTSVSNIVEIVHGTPGERHT